MFWVFYVSVKVNTAYDFRSGKFSVILIWTTRGTRRGFESNKINHTGRSDPILAPDQAQPALSLQPGCMSTVFVSRVSHSPRTQTSWAHLSPPSSDLRWG